jgi:hypothetical protein
MRSGAKGGASCSGAPPLCRLRRNQNPARATAETEAPLNGATVGPNELAKRPAALTATEGEDTYRPVRLSAGLGHR